MREITVSDPMPPESGNRAFASTLSKLERRITVLESPTGTQQAQTVKRLMATIKAQPVLVMPTRRTTGFGLTAAWATYVSVTVEVPEGKTHATIMGVGSAGVLDTKTGGATTAHGRVIIGGDVGSEFPATKDAGASHTNNVIFATHARTFTVVPGELIQVLMQVRPLNADAFTPHTQNFAHIAAVASFTGHETSDKGQKKGDR